jgi:methyl-accepting chemotaxis protein
MRTALVIAFVTVTFVPGAVATVAGVLAFSASMRSEAERTAQTHIRIASDMAAERMQQRAAVLSGFASQSRILDAVAARRRILPKELQAAAGAARCSYVLAVDTSGRVVGASAGPAAGGFGNSPLVFNAVVGRNSTGFERLSPAEVALRDLADPTSLAVRETAGGTVRHKKLEGVTALVSAVPIVGRDGSALGALVGVEAVNGSTSFVDDVAQRLGGTATVFQDEVRVSTTVRTKDGERAWGTVASDPVQRTVLDGGGTFTGVADVVGHANEAAYVPIKDSKGRAIGMLYVGFPTDPYDAATRLFALRFIGAAALGLGLAIAAAFWLSGVLSRPLAAVGEAARQVAERDLTVSAPVDGTRETAELGTAFNAMVATLSQVIVHASGTATRLRTIAEDLERQSESQADSATMQASAVTETTATLEELAATFGAVAAGAEEVMRLAEDALEAAQQGRSMLDASQSELERLFTGAAQVAEAADGVTGASAEIAGAIGIIESIAEQTKILALNAAIEASRAGEAGRGFGVVAAQIRELADSVSASTSRIDLVVKEIRRSTSSLADMSRDQNRMAEESVGLGRKAAGAFGDILEQMQSTAAAARQIAAAAVEQRTATTQVVQAMQQVSTSSNETAHAARQVNTAAQEVRQSGVELDDNLRGFRR